MHCIEGMIKKIIIILFTWKKCSSLVILHGNFKGKCDNSTTGNSETD